MRKAASDGMLTVPVADHDEAIAYHTEKPGFALVEDTLISATRRWVVAASQSATEREDCCWPRLLMPNGAPEEIRTPAPDPSSKYRAAIFSSISIAISIL